MVKTIIEERVSEPVIHEHHDSGSGMGVIIGIIALIVVIFLAFYYGLPYLKGSISPQVNVPSQIDVNIKK